MVLIDLKEPNFGRCGDTNLIQTGHPRYWITFCCPGLETTIMRRPGFYYGVYLVLPAQKQQSTSIQPMILRYFDLILGLRKKQRWFSMVSPNFNGFSQWFLPKNDFSQWSLPMICNELSLVRHIFAGPKRRGSKWNGAMDSLVCHG